MLVKLSNILAQLLVCHTVIPNHMFVQREGSLRKLEERGTARDSGFNFTVAINCEAVCFDFDSVAIFVQLKASKNLGSFYFHLGYRLICMDCLMLRYHHTWPCIMNY
ncbi:hypothetical protein OIU84_018103 [Salix udensis]|uniref:Secreted protein n=1 Tax=Salix udensis TaxID=889485 RepID=A0AAD6L4L6_9ROSI|nr:hypothetical protein OIU84_018103 [Salix udensis]